MFLNVSVGDRRAKRCQHGATAENVGLVLLIPQVFSGPRPMLADRVQSVREGYYGRNIPSS